MRITLSGWIAGLLILCASSHPLQAEPLVERLTIVAPAAPGGGWDQTARAMQHALEAEGIVRRVQVENVPGAAGTIGLSQFINQYRARGDALMVSGLVMLGAILWNGSPVSLAEVTPVARLTGEYEVVAVPATGPHRDMSSIVAALRANPRGVSWGGGSAGGTDHILAGLIVAAAGIDPRRANYIAFSGGGEAVASLLGGNLTAGISGYSEFAPHIETGRLRGIGIAASSRIAGIDIPTLREQGLNVELVNWRAVMAPAGVSPEQRNLLRQLVTELVRSRSWQRFLTELRWSDMFLLGEPFEAFLDAERLRIASIIGPLQNASALNGAADAAEWVFPALIAVAGLAVTFLFLAERGHRLDSGRVRPSGMEEADAANRRLSNRRGLGLTAVGPLLFLVTLNVGGFIFASTLLSISVAAGFGSRRPVRNAAIALVLSAALYVAVTRGLGLALPAGLFEIP